MREIHGILFLLFLSCQVYTQKPFRVAIISDAAQQENHLFEEEIKSEITALLASQYALTFEEVYTDSDVNTINREIQNVYTKNEANVLIGAGIVSSQLLSKQNSFPIPSIASIQLSNNPLQNKAAEQITSGITNFTYLSSPFDIEAGLKVLKEICGCEKIVTLANSSLAMIGINGTDLFTESSKNLEWLPLEGGLSSVLDQLSDEVGGVYILSPLRNYPPEQIKAFLEKLNQRHLPSFTLFDDPVLALGAYAAFASSDNLRKIPRRIALNVEKIAEGKNPKDFPVEMVTFRRQLIVNMETVNKTELYPDWTLLEDALLININRPNTERTLSLKAVIVEGIQNNLGYQIASKQTEIIAQDINLAKSNYLPQLGVESTGFFLDENTVNSSFGTRGSFNWTAGASFSQLILSEPALANIAIQKLLFESQQKVQEQSELDVILEVAQRYFNYMQVLSVAELQNDNVKAINQNLTIASDKQKVGYSGASDVYRWQTELDLAKTELNTTNAQLKAVGYQLNESLNRPLDEEFVIDASEEDVNLFIEELDKSFTGLIQNQNLLNQLADFMVAEALQNLPEIQQVELAIAAQERLLKSNKRAFYLPTLAFGGSYEYPLEIVNPGEPLPIPGVEINNNPAWSAAFNLSIPIFAGGSRKFQKEKTQVGFYQLQDQQKDVRNLLELQVRANVQVVNAAYNNIRLTRNAAASAANNIAIVQDLYKSGQVDVITLVDAQNALLGSQINATNAAYQFMIDFFALQRSIGDYSIFGTEVQNESFLQRFLNFKSKQ